MNRRPLDPQECILDAVACIDVRLRRSRGRMGERLEAGQSTSEQNALPFALPSRTPPSRDPLPLSASNAGLSAAAPTAAQLSMPDVTGSLGSGAPEPLPAAARTSRGSGGIAGGWC
jgi:hypothetical protein